MSTNGISKFVYLLVILLLLQGQVVSATEYRITGFEVNVEVRNTNSEYLYQYTTPKFDYSPNYEMGPQVSTHKGTENNIVVRNVTHFSNLQLASTEDKVGMNDLTIFDIGANEIIGFNEHRIVSLSSNYTKSLLNFSIFEIENNQTKIDNVHLAELDFGPELPSTMEISNIKSTVMNGDWIMSSIVMEDSNYTSNESPWSFWFLRFNLDTGNVSVVDYKTPPVMETIPHNIAISENGIGYFINNVDYTQGSEYHFVVNFEELTIQKIDVSSILGNDVHLDLLDVDENYLYLMKSKSSSSERQIYKMNLASFEFEQIDVVDGTYGDFLVLDDYIILISVDTVGTSNDPVSFKYLWIGIFTFTTITLIAKKDKLNYR